MTTEYQAYQTAVMTFRDRYFALPGDMPNATDFWGAMTGCTATTTGTGTQTCNGNNDGLINAHSTANRSSEELQFWRHIANAGLIEGSYTGITNASGHPANGESLPLSRMGNAAWRTRYFTAVADTFNVNYGNIIHLHSGSMSLEVFLPEEAWNIDSKIDDGLPGQGKLIGRSVSSCTTGTNVNDTSLPYNLTSSTKNCTLIFRNAF